MGWINLRGLFGFVWGFIFVGCWISILLYYSRLLIYLSKNKKDIYKKIFGGEANCPEFLTFMTIPTLRFFIYLFKDSDDDKESLRLKRTFKISLLIALIQVTTLNMVSNFFVIK